jgi:hypothetical protein
MPSREHALVIGLCDNFWCSRVALLRPLFDGQGNEAAHICALGCADNSDEDDEVAA